MDKEKFITAYEIINQIEDLLDKSEDLFDKIDPAIRLAIYRYHNDSSNLNHCLRWGLRWRWGLRAAKEIREDWHNVVSETELGC